MWVVELSLNATSLHYYDFDFIPGLACKAGEFSVRENALFQGHSLYTLANSVFGLLTTFTTKNTVTHNIHQFHR